MRIVDNQPKFRFQNFYPTWFIAINNTILKTLCHNLIINYSSEKVFFLCKYSFLHKYKVSNSVTFHFSLLNYNKYKYFVQSSLYQYK